MRNPHKECTTIVEKASPSEKIKLKVGIFWAQVVDDRVPAIPTLATGLQISSSTCDREKLNNPL